MLMTGCRALIPMVLLSTMSMAQAAAWHQPVLVRAVTAQGAVEGELLAHTSVFRGIPYAAPPVGPLRFMPPSPPVPWSGVRQALDLAPACPQLIERDLTENNHAMMGEDCLALNVFTPRVDVRRRPVLVWIHGGAFVVGSSRNMWYDGSRLAIRGDVVVVTINYRLGAWGFLALGTLGDARYEKSANIGLLDQVAALTWVHDNIARFGGDPDNVTIFGESAGSASVGDLLALPAARGLFAKAIMESGLPGSEPADRGRPARLAAQFLKIAGAKSPADLASKSMDELLTAQEKLFATESGLGTFGPSVDGVVLREAPWTTLSAGRGSRVPLLIGTTRDEMRYFSTVEDIGLERKPRALLKQQLTAIAGAHAEDILAVYQRENPVWGDTVVQIVSDASLRLPSIKLAETLYSGQPVYMYLFTYRSSSSYMSFGSAHSIEIPFVFGVVDVPDVIDFIGRDPRRFALAEHTMDAWIGFARTGDPSPPGGPTWPTYEPVHRRTMELGEPLRLVDDPLPAQRRVWGDAAASKEQMWGLLKDN